MFWVSDMLAIRVWPLQGRGHLHSAEEGNHAPKLCLRFLHPPEWEFSGWFHQGWLDVSTGAREQLEMFMGFAVEVGAERTSSEQLTEACLCRLHRELLFF